MPESAKESILAKGRIAVWLILTFSFVLTLNGKMDSQQFLEIVKLIGAFWLGCEAGARGLD